MTYRRDELPPFAGIPTFLRAPQAELTELDQGMLAVLGVPHDMTLGSRQGCRHGPRGLREGSLDAVSHLKANPTSSLTHVSSGIRTRLAPGNTLVDLGDVDVFPNDLSRSSESMRLRVRAVAQSGAIPILLGGDHFVTYPLFRGWSEGATKRGHSKFGYIQYDNHLDLADDNKIWGKLWHGSQARRISELPSIHPRNMVWMGAAGPHSREQVEWLGASGAKLFTPSHIREDGIVATTHEAVKIASQGTDGVYVSLDIDVVNGGASPGTGAVVTDGLSPQELFISIGILGESGLIGAFDVTEVAPPLDIGGRTIRIGADAILEFVAPKVFVREQHVMQSAD